MNFYTAEKVAQLRYQELIQAGELERELNKAADRAAPRTTIRAHLRSLLSVVGNGLKLRMHPGDLQ